MLSYSKNSLWHIYLRTMETDNKNKKNNIINCTIQSIEKLYLRLYPSKPSDIDKVSSERFKTINKINSIKRLNVSCDIKNELESMLYTDLEEKDKYKFFSN